MLCLLKYDAKHWVQATFFHFSVFEHLLGILWEEAEVERLGITEGRGSLHFLRFVVKFG